VGKKVFFLRTWSHGENLRKDRPSSLSKDNVDKLCLEGLQEVLQVTRKGIGSAENTSSFCGLRKEERTVEILQGDFTKSRGPLDIAELQGGYGENARRFKLRRGIAIDPSQ
jgi:hypothetical protein